MVICNGWLRYNHSSEWILCIQQNLTHSPYGPICFKSGLRAEITRRAAKPSVRECPTLRDHFFSFPCRSTVRLGTELKRMCDQAPHQLRIPGGEEFSQRDPNF